jgi:hypothetical protein
MSCRDSSDDKGLKPLFVIPHEKHREDVEEIVGDDTNIMFITTPGQVGSCMPSIPSVVVGLSAPYSTALQLSESTKFLLCILLLCEAHLPHQRLRRCRRHQHRRRPARQRPRQAMVNELTASFLLLFSHSCHVMPCGHSMLCFVPLSSVALFSSTEKASLFLPYAEDKGSCTVITSVTGKLIDIDV